MGAGPSRVLHALKQPDLTPQEGPVALTTETDPSCALGAAGGSPPPALDLCSLYSGLLLLAFPNEGSVPFPHPLPPELLSIEPEINLPLLWPH